MFVLVLRHGKSYAQLPIIKISALKRFLMQLHKVKLILSQWKQYHRRINMDILLGTVNGEKENASFYMNGNTLIFGTYDKRSTIPDSSIKELNGKYYADLDFLKFDSEFKHIEIPESVLSACDRIRKENDLIKNSAGNIAVSYTHLTLPT